MVRVGARIVLIVMPVYLVKRTGLMNVNIQNGMTDMQLPLERNKWWGYLHTEGTINAKRWWGEQSNDDIDDAHSSPFVVRVIGPFEADTREDALRHIKMEL